MIEMKERRREIGLRLIGLCLLYVRGLARGSERERDASRMLDMYRESYRRETGEEATELMVIEAMRRRRLEMEGKVKDEEKEGEPVENSLHPNGRECQASLRRCPYEVKGSRATKGNRTGKKNTPNVIQPEDSDRVKKQKLTKAFDEARRDKKVHTGLAAGKKGEVILAPGDIRHGGTHHADRPEHGKKISSQKLAETLLHGEKKNDKGKDVKIEGKGNVKIMLTPEPEFPTQAPGQKHPENPKGNMSGKNWLRGK